MAHFLDKMTDALKESLERAIKDKEIDKLISGKLDTLAQQFVDYVTCCIKDDLAGDVAIAAKNMACAWIDALLSGDSEAAQSAFAATGFRYVGVYSDGKFYENASMLLRARIISQHRDLIESERIKDLELVIAKMADTIREKSR